MFACHFVKEKTLKSRSGMRQAFRGALSTRQSRIKLLESLDGFRYRRSTTGYRATPPRITWGLTLIELVVVLGILAMMATIAVQSLEPIADQARYDQSVLILERTRDAITSPANPIKNSSASYIGDTGLVPASLGALLQKPIGLADHSVQWFDSDRDSVNDIVLESGWRGPYLQLGVGQTDIIDGWGRALTLQNNSGALTLFSTGADGDSVLPEDDYDADLPTTIANQDYLSNLILRVYSIDSLNGSRIDPSPTGTEAICVLFYAANANGGTTGAVEEQSLTISAASGFQAVRTQTVQGSIAARAILWQDTNTDGTINIGETILKKSCVTYVRFAPDHNRIDLELR